MLARQLLCVATSAAIQCTAVPPTGVFSCTEHDDCPPTLVCASDGLCRTRDVLIGENERAATRGGAAGGGSEGARAGRGAKPASGMMQSAGESAATPEPAAGSSGAASIDAGGVESSGEAGASTAGSGGRAEDAGMPDGGGRPTTSGTMDCDRACLLAELEAYLDALLARDASKLKVSAVLKYTENGVATQLGDGLWKTASSLVPDRRLEFADPVTHNVAGQLVVKENMTAPVIYQVRLKIVAGEISEIESVVVRPLGASTFYPDGMKPQPEFLQSIAADKRMSRAAMQMLTDDFLNYAQGLTSAAPFAPTCRRYVNGTITASSASALQMWSRPMPSGEPAKRRTLIIDEAAGITWGMYPSGTQNYVNVSGLALKLVDSRVAMIQDVVASMPSKAWD